MKNINIISLITAIATLATAIVTYTMINEMKKQRIVNSKKQYY